MDDLTELFIRFIDQYRAVDIANAEFHKLLDEDPEVREEYSQWCAATGSSEKMGFLDFCDDFRANQQSIYDNLSDFDE